MPDIVLVTGPEFVVGGGGGREGGGGKGRREEELGGGGVGSHAGVPPRKNTLHFLVIKVLLGWAAHAAP